MPQKSGSHLDTVSTGSGSDLVNYKRVKMFVRMLVDNQVKNVPTGNLAEAARFLVDYQISKTLEASGYPIEIVEITAKGRVSFTYCDPRCSPKKIT